MAMASVNIVKCCLQLVSDVAHLSATAVVIVNGACITYVKLPNLAASVLLHTVVHQQHWSGFYCMVTEWHILAAAG